MSTTEIELPDGVWDAAMAARDAVRYIDHPDNYEAVYGMSRYAVRAVIAAAFAAGRESVGRLIEADVKTCFESQIWYSDGETEEFVHVGPSEGLADHVIARVREKLGTSDGVATVVRSEARSYEVHTYRVNEQVLARFGEWEEADAVR